MLLELLCSGSKRKFLLVCMSDFLLHFTRTGHPIDLTLGVRQHWVWSRLDALFLRILEAPLLWTKQSVSLLQMDISSELPHASNMYYDWHSNNPESSDTWGQAIAQFQMSANYKMATCQTGIVYAYFFLHWRESTSLKYSFEDNIYAFNNGKPQY